MKSAFKLQLVIALQRQYVHIFVKEFWKKSIFQRRTLWWK